MWLLASTRAPTFYGRVARSFPLGKRKLGLGPRFTCMSTSTAVAWPMAKLRARPLRSTDRPQRPVRFGGSLHIPSQGEAAVDHQNLAGDVALGIDQQPNRAGDVLGTAETRNDAAVDHRIVFARVDRRAGHARGGDAGGDHVDVDAAGTSEFLGQDARAVDEGGLRRAVGERTLEGVGPLHAREQDDGPAGGAFTHGHRHIARQKKRGHRVQIESVLERLGLELGGFRPSGVAGEHDEAVNAITRAKNVVEEPATSRGIADVALGEADRARVVVLKSLTNELSPALVVAVAKDRVSALGDEKGRGGGAEAAGASRDQDHAPGQRPPRVVELQLIVSRAFFRIEMRTGHCRDCRGDACGRPKTIRI